MQGPGFEFQILHFSTHNMKKKSIKKQANLLNQLTQVKVWKNWWSGVFLLRGECESAFVSYIKIIIIYCFCINFTYFNVAIYDLFSNWGRILVGLGSPKWTFLIRKTSNNQWPNFGQFYESIGFWVFFTK